jgi:hypothetical protein
MRSVTAALLFAAVSCRSDEKKDVTQPTHRGVYIAGNQLNSLTICDGRKIYWVVGRASFGLQARYQQLTRRPFQPIYVELLAEVVPPGNQALMEAHDGNIRVDTVLEARTTVPRTCKLPATDE